MSRTSLGVALLIALQSCRPCEGVWDCKHVQDEWPDTKKAWCCENPDECGLQSSADSRRMYYSRPYDCQAGKTHWRHGWSETKKQWCCFHDNRAYCSTVYPHSEPYDCNAGYHLRSTGWSEPKKQWCCANRGVCSHGPVHSYDCQAGLEKWRTGWSQDKKDHCCARYQLGCDHDSTWGRRRDTTWSRRRDTTWSRRRWSPHHSEPYDCQDGLRNWMKGWSANKKSWCCHTYSLGCQVTGHHYNCLAGVPNWRNGWSPAKKVWCCAHGYEGCHSHITYLPPVQTYGHGRPTPTYGMKFASIKAVIVRNVTWPAMFSLTAGISVLAVVYFLAQLRKRRREAAGQALMAVESQDEFLKE